MNDQYVPVPSDWVEMLEELAARNAVCEIIFRSENGGRAIIRDKVLEIKDEENEQWLKTGSGLEIRLDRLLEVGGRQFSNYC